MPLSGNQSFGMAGGGEIVIEEIPITTAGQTVFALAQFPNPLTLSLNVNGVDYFTTSVVLAGNIVTWNGPMPLAPSDKLIATYNAL